MTKIISPENGQETIIPTPTPTEVKNFVRNLTVTKKTLKCGVIIKTWTNEKAGFSEKTYTYQDMDLAQLGTDGVLYWNSKYWRKPEIREKLKNIYSVIRRRSKATKFSEYMDL